MSFRFNDPQYLMWLWSLPALLMLFLAVERAQAKRLKKGFGGKMAPILTQSVSVAARKWKTLLMLFALLCFILALARPQMGEGMTTVKAEGVEVMIAFDVSTSMLAEDVKPSRLEHAKLEVIRLLDSFGGDKVGLVAFAGSAVMVSPLTTDKSALKMYVESLSPESVETQGTEFRKAFREVRAGFERGGIDPAEGVRVTRVVLLISDGEDQEPGAIEEAKKMATEGIRIFSFAVGTEKGAPIPLRDERGFLKGYKKDKSNSEVMTKVKGSVLRDLAEAGRGRFYFSTVGGSEMRSMKSDLDRLEKAQFASEQATQYNERFQIPLSIGLLFALISVLIRERRSASKIWRGRFPTSGGFGVIFWFCCLFAGVGLRSEVAFALDPVAKVDSVITNNQGVDLFMKERYFESFQKFTKSLAMDPFQAEVHFNLADTFLLNKEYEKAIQGFEDAVKLTKDRGIEFRARFNQAIAATELKRIDEALDYYQRALLIDPSSVEVKTNIELLIQQQQSQSQGGDGENKDQKSGKDGDQKKDQGKEDQDKQEKKGDGDEKKPDGPPQNGKKPEPKPFQSKEIGEQDVKRILEELKNQEEQIRAKYQREGSKDAPRDKDW